MLKNHTNIVIFPSANIIPLAGHAFKENTFRARRARIEGDAVLIGRIHDRYEVFIADEIRS